MPNTTTTNAVVATATATAANAANWGTPAAPAGTMPEQARRSTLGKAIAPRLAGGIAYAAVTQAVAALDKGSSVTDAQQSALDAFCGQVRNILNKLVQNHTVCTVYNYLQDRTGGKYTRQQVREALPDFTPVHGLQDSKHLRGILSNAIVAQRVGMVLVEQSTNAGGRVRTGFAPCASVAPAPAPADTPEAKPTTTGKGKRK